MTEVWREHGGQRLFREDLEQGRFRYLIVRDDTAAEATVRVDNAVPEVVIWADDDGFIVPAPICIAVATNQLEPFFVTPALAGYLVHKLGFAVRFATPCFVTRTGADGIVRLERSTARQGRV
jgi:hypothetical protein